MRLNKSDKESFVRRVMQDVPQIDFDELARAAIQDDALKQMPATIRAIYDDVSLRPFLYLKYVSANFNGQVCVYAGYDYTGSHELCVKLDELREGYYKQKRDRADLEMRVRSMIYSCNTIQNARKTLPEFAEYLPDREPVCKTLPAVTNVVTDLMLAGWKQPKADA